MATIKVYSAMSSSTKTSLKHSAIHQQIHKVNQARMELSQSRTHNSIQGTMTSIYNLGCFVGAMSTIFTGDIFGRPKQILVGSTVIAIGAVIQTAAYGVPQMMVGRVVAGLGTGMNTATAGVWQSETRFVCTLVTRCQKADNQTVRCGVVES